MLRNERKNKRLIKRYPFLQVREGYYESTWLDSFLAGWRKKFGIKFCKDILKTLNRVGYPINEFSFTDIKEKWGRFTCYYIGPFEIEDVIEKYEDLSIKICCLCGRKASYVSEGWISYFCEKCVKQNDRDYRTSFKPIIKQENK